MGKVQALVTKHLSNRGYSVIKTAQPKITQKANFDRRNPTLMKDEPTVNFPLTFVYAFVFQADHLSRTPSIQNERISEVNAGPFDLLLTTEREIGQQRVKTRLTNDLEGAQIINPTDQTARHRHQHPRAIHFDTQVGRFLYENTIPSGDNE